MLTSENKQVQLTTSHDNLCPHRVDPVAFSALTLLVWQQKEHPACKKTEWWNAGVVICLG